MKKIIFLIMTMLVFTSCLTKVNVDNKGDLNLSIKLPATTNKSISKTIPVGTDKIEIYLHNTETSAEISRTISHSDGQVHQLEFTDMQTGNWILDVALYSGTSQLGGYYDNITISSETPTVVSHSFGSPNAISYVYDDSVGASANLYFGDGETGLNSGYLAVYDSGSSLNNISELNTAVFYVSTKEDFSTNVLSSSPINSSGQGYPISIFVSTTTIDGLSEMLTPNTKYYWKVILTNSIGSTTSKTFSFTTGQP